MHHSVDVMFPYWVDVGLITGRVSATVVVCDFLVIYFCAFVTTFMQTEMLIFSLFSSDESECTIYTLPGVPLGRQTKTVFSC